MSGNTAHDVTETIVTGYIRDAKSLFIALNNPYYNIPNGVSMITLSYIENIFSNHGKYEWKITDHLFVNKILNAKCGDKFESDPFILSRLKCKLLIYPNGNNEELRGYFVIHLYIELSSDIDCIIFTRVFRVKENFASNTWRSTVLNGDYEYWTKHCPLSELIHINPKTITIEIEMNIERLIIKNNAYLNPLKNIKFAINNNPNFAMKNHIEYYLKKNEIKLMKESENKNGKSMCSDIVDNMWSISIYPKQSMEIYLKMCYFPQNINKLQVEYTVSCNNAIKNALPNKYRYTNIFSVQHHSWGPEQWIKLNDISNEKSITFSIDLEILHVEYQYQTKQNSEKISDLCNSMKIAYLLSG